MGIITYVKLGVVLAVILGLGGAFLKYKHAINENAILKVQAAEQQKVIEWYEKAAKIDSDTAEVHNEIKKAIESNDPERVRDQYRKLREHSRFTPNKVAPAPSP